MATDSLFTDVQSAPAIEVFELTAKCNADEHPHKVNLGVGAYRTDDGKPWVLPVVRTVEAEMASNLLLNHEYLPVAGMTDFCTQATKLLLGEDSPSITNNRVQGVQCLGGTGAIRVAADFMHKHLGCNVVYISKPTWANHRGIFKTAGYEVCEYRYWDAESRSLNFEGLCEDFNNAPEKAVVVLHGCAHNPTGVDATEKQWEKIAEIVKAKKLVILVDQAYQGFASGDLDKDAFAVRYLERQGFEFFIAQSFSKNFGLYNERVGNLIVICKKAEDKMKVKSQLEITVRTMWSNPPNHGARVVCTVLNNPAYLAEWKGHVRQMAERILLMREMLHNKLKALGCPGSWEHITTQKGMFSYTGLTGNQVDKLKTKYHIYMLKSGRINMCGLTSGNIDYVAAAISDIVTNSASNEDDQTQSKM